MALTLLLLSDGYEDVRDLLPELPMTPFELRRAPLKSTVPQDLIALHPDLLLIDGTGDADAAENATRTMALAWEIGLPPLIVVVDAATLPPSAPRVTSTRLPSRPSVAAMSSSSGASPQHRPS